MHLAIQNSFPNLSISAEREFIARVHRVGHDLGWQVTDVVTSDDILECAPDAVLVTHEFTPKLTRFPTLGVIWSPTDYFAGDPQRIRNILSYDGCLVATDGLRDWTWALFRDHGKTAPISKFNFLPTAIALRNPTLPPEPRLFYAGVHWDGARHGDLFAALEGRCPLRIYGKPERWQDRSRDYAGILPFDGSSVVEAISQCGIALALHTEHHLRGNVPSMRLFEAAAAGAVIIGDRMPFVERNFDDTVLLIDTDRPVADVATAIATHVNWVVDNPEASAALARRSHMVFREKFDLRDQLSQLPAFVDDVVRISSGPRTTRGHESHGAQNPGPLVEVIMRVGSRPAVTIARSLESLAAQSYADIGLIVVKFRNVAGLEALLDAQAARFRHVRVIEVPDDGMRSRALWAGLNAASGTYVCNLDDDDAIHPEHIGGLVRAFKAAPPNVPLVYSGTIEVQEEDGHWFDQPNFRGDIDAIIPERRRLRFMDSFSADRMVAFDNFVNSNAWMARRSALTPDILEDPSVRVAEDVYLYLMLMRQGPFRLVPAATAEWFWRSSSRDNSMFSQPVWAEDGPKVAARLRALGALPAAPDEGSVATHDGGTGPVVKSRAVAASSQLHRVLRRPSLLLGSYAPAWRRFRQRWRG
jgi:hypothetical protein